MKLLLLLLLVPALAEARTEGRTLAYPRDQVWPTAVRFVAVDERAKIVDKDSDAGYVLFEVAQDEKTQLRGSLEIVTVVVDGNPYVKFVVNLIDGPLWMEAGMLKRLEQKVRKDLGMPPPPKPKAPPKEDGRGDNDENDDKAKDATPGSAGARGNANALRRSIQRPEQR